MTDVVHMGGGHQTLAATWPPEASCPHILDCFMDHRHAGTPNHRWQDDGGAHPLWVISREHEMLRAPLRGGIGCPSGERLRRVFGNTTHVLAITHDDSSGPDLDEALHTPRFCCRQNIAGTIDIRTFKRFRCPPQLEQRRRMKNHVGVTDALLQRGDAIERPLHWLRAQRLQLGTVGR